MMYYMNAGGPLMWVLLLMSITALTIILDRAFFFFKKEGTHNRNFEKDIIKEVQNGNIDGAISICEKEKNSVGYVVKGFLTRCEKNMDFHYYDQLLKEIAFDEISSLERRLHLLGLIGNMATMVGLLGTVTGMIKAFKNLATFGAGDPTFVAGGISEALITTASGLIIAIPTIFAYNIFSKKIENAEGDIDKITTIIINILTGKK